MPDSRAQLLEMIRRTDAARREAGEVMSAVRAALVTLSAAESKVVAVRGDLEGVLHRGGKVIDLYFRLRLEQEALLKAIRGDSDPGE